MANGFVHIESSLQTTQEAGTPNEHMLVTLTFSIEIAGRRKDGYSVQVKQPVGSNYGRDHLEIIVPPQLNVPVSFDQLQRCAEDYCHSVILPPDFVRLGGSGTFANNQVGAKRSYPVTVNESLTGGW